MVGRGLIIVLPYYLCLLRWWFSIILRLNIITRTINQIISACIKYIFTFTQMLQNFETLHLIYLENNNCMNYQELFNVRKYITLKSIYRVRQNLSSFNGLNWKTIPIFFRTTLPWGKTHLTKQYLKKSLVLLQIVFSLHRYFW